MKQLSSISVGSKIFQIQTEIPTYPAPHIRSMVILDGKVILKKINDSIQDLDQERINQLVDEQHIAVEEEIRAKLTALAAKKKQ